MVVVAGPNGCGKSCLFDAIRFLKSAYGGYQPGEWQQWFSEFQINIQAKRGDLRKLFYNKSKAITVRAEFEFSPDELAYLRSNVPW